MADYVSREVARERLRKACKGGSIISVIVLLLGLCYGGIAAVIGMGVQIAFQPLYDLLYLVVPTMGDTILAMADCATKAVLLFLVGLLGILMCHKIAKTGEAFRTGQLRQLKLIAFFLMLLGFFPTVVGNAIKIVQAMQAGTATLAVMSFAAEPMCILSGLVMFMLARVLVTGAKLGTQESGMAAIDPIANVPEPNYSDVPDLAQVTTAVDVPASASDTLWNDATAVEGEVAEVEQTQVR